MNTRIARCVARWRFAAACFAVAVAVAAAVPAAIAAGTPGRDASAADLARFVAALPSAQRAAMMHGALGALLRAQGVPAAQGDVDARAPWTPDFSRAAAPAAASLRPFGGGSLWKQTRVLTGEIYDGVIPLDTVSGNVHTKFNYFEYLASSDDTLVAYALYETRSPLYPDPVTDPQLGPGKLHFYEKRNGEWQRVQDLDAPPEVASAIQSGGNSTFGLNGRAISSDTLMIGAPGLDAVYVYRRANGTWSQTQVLSDGVRAENGGTFGQSIALQGNHALIADVTENGWSGAVYAYTESNGIWTQTQRLALDGEPPFALFGAGLVVDGSTALIDSFTLTSDGSDPVVYVHALDASSGQWSVVQSLKSCGVTAGGYVYQFGSEMALAGDTAVISDTNGSLDTPDNTLSAGIACVFTRQNGVWTNTQALTPDDGVAGATFGWGVALKGDLLAINSYHADINGSDDGGALYLYTPDASGWSMADEVLATKDGPFGFDTVGNDDTPIQLFTTDFAIDGNAIVGFPARAGTDDGGFGIFDLPAQATATPDALTLSLAAGARTSATVRLGNTGAGHALGFELSDGGTLTQTSEDAPVPGMGIGIPRCRLGLADSSDWTGLACLEVTGTSAASWYRRFYFGEYPQVGASATIDAVTVGIESAPAGIPVSVRLYTKPHDDGAVDTLDPYQLVPIGEGSTVADGTPHSLLRIPIFGTATVSDTAHQDLVVEEHVDDFLGMPAFVPGAIASPQTHKTFMTYVNNTVGMSYAVPGLSDCCTARGSHILISPHLNPVASGIDCATPTSAPWLAATPGQGRIEAAGAKDIAVTLDASYLAPGRYSTHLCLATKSPMPSFLRIPVELTVTDANEPIFKDGFDGTQP